MKIYSIKVETDQGEAFIELNVNVEGPVALRLENKEEVIAKIIIK